MDVNRSSECVVCNLSFDSMKDFLKHTLSSEHQEIIREMIMDLDEADPIEPRPKAKKASPIALTIPENMVRIYNPDEDEYFLIPKPKLKLKITPKILLMLNPNSNPNIKIISTLESSINVKNVIGNLEMK